MHKALSTVLPGVIYTPWGPSDYVKDLPLGAVSVSTSSHGGIWIPLDLYNRLPSGLQETAYSSGGWYEEDFDAAIPFAFFELGASREKIEVARSMVLAKWPERVPQTVKEDWKADSREGSQP